MKKSKIIAVGSYLPKKVLTNDDMAKIVDTSDEWITERTGIKQRHIAADGEFTSDLAANALRQCMANGGIEANSIDGIIVATTTPDLVFPAVATTVQHKIGIDNNGFAFDINAVCTGFIYALSVADSMLRSGMAKRIAVIGAETMSRVLDWKDRTTCVLFADGAGAFILEQTTEDDASGIIDSALYSDGSLNDILKVPGGVSCGINPDAKLCMNGKEVFKVAITKGFECSNTILQRNNLDVSNVDTFIMHQANKRILDMVADKLKIPSKKVAISINKHANTSAASIPLAFCEHYNNNISKGDVVLFTAFGGGMTWGSVLARL